MTDGSDKPDKPDPFAPLPLAAMPPVRGRDESGPTPKATKKTATSGTTRGETLPGATPPTVTPPATISATPPSAPPPSARTRAPSIPPTAFAQSAPPPDEVSWTGSSGQRLTGQQPSGGRAAMADLAELGPAGGQAVSVEQASVAGSDVLGPAGGRDLSGGAGETPAGMSWSDAAQSGAQQAWTEAPADAVPEAPLLPQTYNEDELRDAVGATPRVEPSKKKPAPVRDRDDNDDDDDGGSKKMSRKTVFVAAASIVVGGGIAALVLLGKLNSAHYSIACDEDQVVVEQGRSFPPWGSSSLDGAEWKPLKIPPESACHPRETEDRAELAGWYLTMLTDFADKQLSAREITKVDDAEAALKQALLVTRALRTDDDAKNARNDIDRLLGDVVYWRASARLKGASDALTDAAKQFDAAATARPQHFKDAAEWAKYTRTVIDQLRAGPGGVPSATFPPLPPAERPTAPNGVALPIEPEGSGAEPPTPAPDAGVPTGGVLL